MNNTTDISNSTAFDKLTSEPLEYLMCRYGTGYALGFKGDTKNINLAYNLFTNFAETRTSLIWIHDSLAYIFISADKIVSALELYFYTNILLNKEVSASSSWNEEKGEYTLTQDEAKARELAKQYTEKFINNVIKVQSFLPASFKVDDREF